jgi:hypothetical protein
MMLNKMKRQLAIWLVRDDPEVLILRRGAGTREPFLARGAVRGVGGNEPALLTWGVGIMWDTEMMNCWNVSSDTPVEVIDVYQLPGETA